MQINIKSTIFSFAALVLRASCEGGYKKADVYANTQAQNGQSAALTAECDALRKQVEALRASARSYRDKLLQLLQQQRELLDQNSELF